MASGNLKLDCILLLKNLTFWIVIGAACGVGLALATGDAPNFDSSPLYSLVLLLKTGFLQLLKMLIAPMIFFSLVGGLLSIGTTVRLRQLGGLTVFYYLSTTSIAILIGLTIVLFIHPWTNYPAISTLAADTAMDQGRMTLIDPSNNSVIEVLIQIVNQAFVNPFSALAELNIIGIVTNAVLIGLAMLLVLPANSPVITLVEQVNMVIARILGWIIMTLPIGIFAILFDFTIRISAESGASGVVLTQLLSFALLVLGATMFHALLVLPGIAYLFSGLSPKALFTKIARPLLVALSTSSSAATLPVSMKCAEEELEVSESVRSFVLPLGATMNMDGSALFEAIAAVFMAYLYGVELTTVSMITIFLMAMIASIGAPGMPSVSMAGMQIVLLSVGIPLEAIGLLLVIERPLDTFRTAANVEGDLIGTVVIQSRLQQVAANADESHATQDLE
jgi:Na+/H+-dicarboxylate symporter